MLRTRSGLSCELCALLCAGSWGSVVLVLVLAKSTSSSRKHHRLFVLVTVAIRALWTLSHGGHPCASNRVWCNRGTHDS